MTHFSGLLLVCSAIFGCLPHITDAAYAEQAGCSQRVILGTEINPSFHVAERKFVVDDHAALS